MTKREVVSEKIDVVQERIQEKDVFVTEYVNEATRFSAIIKQRFSDFQVFEIDGDGTVTHLTSLDDDSDNNKLKTEVECPVILDDDDDININDTPAKELCYPLKSDEQWKQLTLLMKRGKKEESIRIEVTNINKNDRTSLHESVKQRFGTKLYTQTIEDADKRKYIVVGTNKNVDKRNSWTWPKDLPQYLYFVLYKENIDTINAVRTISKSLRISQNSISYAGTKDRRAVTTQWMCVRRISSKRISSLSRNRLWFGNFKYKDTPLSLGELKGNRFVVALRQVESTGENVEQTLKVLKERGFINYYGLQRFGSYSAAPTYEIGRCLICSEWKQAIDLILNPRPDEKQSDIQEACKIWATTHDALKALQCLRRDMSAEGIIIRTLAEQGNTAFVNALQKVPRNILLLYLHSFQSLVWNRIVSRRIKEFGWSVLPGDLVYDASSNDSIDGSATEKDSESNEISEKSVRFVTEDDATNVSIYDIVYPLPGYSIKYPENEIAKWYTEILAEYDVSGFDNKNKMFSVSGDYRKMLILPENVEWKIVRYNDPNADLVTTDLQKLKNENTVENVESGIHKAVILEFSLPACTYATMAIRELTKADTSSSHQASLTSTYLQSKRPKLSDEDSFAS